MTRAVGAPSMKPAEWGVNPARVDSVWRPFWANALCAIGWPENGAYDYARRLAPSTYELGSGGSIKTHQTGRGVYFDPSTLAAGDAIQWAEAPQVQLTTWVCGITFNWQNSQDVFWTRWFGSADGDVFYVGPGNYSDGTLGFRSSGLTLQARNINLSGLEGRDLFALWWRRWDGERPHSAVYDAVTGEQLRRFDVTGQSSTGSADLSAVGTNHWCLASSTRAVGASHTTIQSAFLINGWHGQGFLDALIADPFGPFRPTRRTIVPVASGVTLAVHESVFGHVLDASGLTQAQSLLPAESEHAHALDGSDLTQAHSIQPAESGHAHTLDSSGLTQDHSIAPAESVVDHLLDSSGLFQSGSLAPAESAHDHDVDASGLTQANDLTPGESEHGHSLDASDITQANDIAPGESDHAHTAEEVGLSSGTIVDPTDSEHAHTADAADLTQAHVLAIGAALHAHAVDDVALTQAHAILIAEAFFAHMIDSGGVSQAGVFAGDPVRRLTLSSEAAFPLYLGAWLAFRLYLGEES